MLVDGGEWWTKMRGWRSPKHAKTIIYVPPHLPISTKQNQMDTQWLKDAQEHFTEAMDKMDWDMALAVIHDVKDKGFTSESDIMYMKWGVMKPLGVNLSATLPSAPHGYILGFLRKKNEEYKAKGLVPTLDMLIEDLTN